MNPELCPVAKGRARAVGLGDPLYVPAVLVEVAAPDALLDIEPRRRPR